MSHFRGWIGANMNVQWREEKLQQLIDTASEDGDVQYVMSGDTILVKLSYPNGRAHILDCLIRRTCEVTSESVREARMKKILDQLSPEDSKFVEQYVAEACRRERES
jgi:hypothetical protein